MAASLARLLLAVAVLVALSAPHSLSAAVVVIASHALGNVAPLAPAAAGVPPLAIAVSQSRAGLAGATAAQTALRFHTLETGSCLLFGRSG